MDMSTFTQNQLRAHYFRTGNATAVTTLYVSLHTADPGVTGASEVTGGSYARVQHGPSDATWTAEATNGLTENASTITFPTPSAAWGSVTHMGFWDAATVGNFLFGVALTTPKTINNGDPAPTFPAGDLSMQFS